MTQIMQARLVESAVGATHPGMLAQLLERLLNGIDFQRAAIASYKEGGLGGFGVIGFTSLGGIPHQSLFQVAADRQSLDF